MVSTSLMIYTVCLHLSQELSLSLSLVSHTCCREDFGNDVKITKSSVNYMKQ